MERILNNVFGNLFDLNWKMVKGIGIYWFMGIRVIKWLDLEGKRLMIRRREREKFVDESFRIDIEVGDIVLCECLLNDIIVGFYLLSRKDYKLCGW